MKLSRRARVFLFLGICLLAAIVLLYLAGPGIERRTRALVIAELSQRFDSNVELLQLHLQFWPSLTVTGSGLTLRARNRPLAPPLLHADTFSFGLGLRGLLRAPHAISELRVQHLVITVPPKEKNGERPSSAPSEARRPPNVVFHRVICTDAALIILPRKQGSQPLNFDIHDLRLSEVSIDRPFSFEGKLTNAKPVGEVATSGIFGPWNIEEPGDTPVAGKYEFTGADLDPLAGIAGTLSSKGSFSGQLNQIEVQGETDTPNFSLDPVGRAMPLHTDFSATVDGLDGDTYLHPVRAILGQSLIVANGSVVLDVEHGGHRITLDAFAPKARLGDITSLAVKSEKPVMLGSVSLRTRILILPGEERTLGRLQLQGDFGVEDARFQSEDVRERLQALSRRALGEPKNEEAGSALTDLQGRFSLEHAVIHFQELVFKLEGAAADLSGTYDIHAARMDFRGRLELKAELSQLVSGPKSLLLKPLDPFFHKRGQGTVLPITITGPRDEPTLAVSALHKTFRKKLGTDGLMAPQK